MNAEQIAFGALQEAHGWLNAGRPELAEVAIADAQRHLERAEEERGGAIDDGCDMERRLTA